MNKYRKIILLVVFLVSIIFQINARKFNIKDVKEPEETVDYRPDKYIKNSALDVILSNKTFINLMFRDFTKFLRKVTESKYFTFFLSLIGYESIYIRLTTMIEKLIYASLDPKK